MTTTWLLLLPPDVTTRIAAFISPSFSTALFGFASLHSSLAQSAFAAFDNKLDIEFTRQGDDADWTRLCPPTARNALFHNEHVHDKTIAEMATENIQSVNIAIHSEYMSGLIEAAFRCVTLCRNVKKLSIASHVGGDCGLLWQCLGGLRLEELALSCDAGRCLSEEGKCIFKQREYFGDGVNVLSDCSPSLKVLEVPDCALNLLGVNGWPVIDGLPHLEKVVVKGKVSVDLTDRLPSCVYMKLYHPYAHINLDALSFGDKLISLATSECLTARHIPKLSTCVNLQELSLDIETGCELELARVLKTFKLQSLVLTWGEKRKQNVQSALRGIAAWRNESRGFWTDEEVEYSYVGEGRVLQLVKAAGKVKTLGLCRVVIGLDEWEEILRFVGEGLHELKVYVKQQDQRAIERWEALILLAVRFCPNIRELRVQDGVTEVLRHARIARALEFYQVHCPYGKLDAHMPMRMGSILKWRRYEYALSDDALANLCDESPCPWV